jgi:hypothetical protein
MALLSLIFGEKTKARIGVVELDASLSETHSMSAEVTNHPLEEGSEISDHIRKQPDSIQITGVVSNTPLVYLANIQAPSPLVNDLTPVSDRAELAYVELQRIMSQGETVEVVTSLRTYENMALTSLSITRDAASGNVLNASMDLREVIIAKSEVVSAPVPATPANAPPINGGRQPTQPASPSTSSAAINKARI